MTPTEDVVLEQQVVECIRFLAVDAVERAKSGHPGMPMGMADAAFVLWTRFLRHDPRDPAWPGRDRFVLSAGHGSMLLYALLHLSGYDLPLEELQRFRQWGSRTPGHPERGHTPGVETTTGPLGQGFANGVGLALAARMLDARFADAGFTPTPGRVFGIVSDGDLMEGVSAEAASLAGHWGLGNLIYLWDDNHVTIEGATELAWSDDVPVRFAAHGWHVLRVDAHDRAAVATALAAAVAERERPSLIAARSHIGYGAPHKQDSAAAHGEPLGGEETAAAKRARGWPESPAFLVPEPVRAFFAERAAALASEADAWRTQLAAWRARDPQRAAAWDAAIEGRVPEDLFERLIAAAPAGAGATRAHGAAVLQQAAALVPALVSGSADLEPSTRTRIAGAPPIQRGAWGGRNLHFGVREHAMGGILNGLALHGGVVPCGSSFLVFSDYARPALRLSALMGLRVVWVFTHDSLFLGEDGPTHQPIEHLGALRAIPNLLVIRPADGLETAAAWALALERREGPTLLALTRQSVPPIERARGFEPRHLRRGGYVVREAAGRESLALAATGSEVALALEVASRLEAEGLGARVVSVPAPTLFLEQDAAWRDATLPPTLPVVTLEAGRTDFWHRFTGRGGLALGIDRFGASAPAADLARGYGFTPEQVSAHVLAWSRARH
jgi:transketolase